MLAAHREGDIGAGFPRTACPDEQEFADTIRRDSARWAQVIKRSGARID